MTEDSIGDPTRIAQLFASELTGLETGRLDAVSVTDADPDAEPSPGGTTAYTIDYAGERIGAVVLYPDAAVVELADVAAASGEPIRIETGAASKRALDRIRAVLESVDGE